MASPATLLYEQRDFPVFQNRMYGSYADARACPRGDIRLVRDADTGLVYNQAFCPELLQYDCHYQNEQAVSAAFQRHLGEVASIVGTQLGHDGLIEVGCGKGYFLELLNKNGFTVRGFDPAYEGDNQRIERRCFDPTIGLTSKGLILRHVLEHMPGPLDFLKQLRAANGCAGLIYIEVPCLDWIRERRAWFDIYYEHVNYFRLSDFHRIFEDIRVAGRLFGGQYLYVVAELASLREPVSGVEESFRLPDDFLSGIAGSRQQAAGSRQQAACRCLGRSVQRCHLRSATRATRAAGRCGHRRQPRQTEPLPACHRAGGACSRPRTCATTGRFTTLHHEFQLQRRNKIDVWRAL